MEEEQKVIQKEEQKVEAPKVEAPKVEAPKVEAPKVIITPPKAGPVIVSFLKKPIWG
jgi:hypothetical protein